MPQKRIKPSLKKLVVKEKNKAPYLGIRDLSALILRKYKITISKSAVHNILKAKGIKATSGPKLAILKYQTQEFRHCGLVLLRALDSEVGLFDQLTLGLKGYFPKINRKLLRKLIILASFSSLVNKDLKDCLKEKGFLRLASLTSLSQAQVDYFEKMLKHYKPIVDLRPVKDNLRLVSTIKFYFKNGCKGYCDARMSTFWESACRNKHFFLISGQAQSRLNQMLEEKALIVGYTKSFDYLSPLVFNFLEGLKSGLKHYEFLDQEGKVLKRAEVKESKINLFFGYSPQILSRAFEFVSSPKGYRKLTWPQIGEFFLSQAKVKIVQSRLKPELKLCTILVKPNKAGLASWGILSTAYFVGAHSCAPLLKRYLYLWPFTWKGFLKDITSIEKSLFSLKYPKLKDDLGQILPKRLQFKEIRDFAYSGQILSVIFKETIWGWEPKARKGYFNLGKDYVRILLKSMPLEAKNSFNQAGFSIDKKRAFLA